MNNIYITSNNQNNIKNLFNRYCSTKPNQTNLIKLFRIHPKVFFVAESSEFLSEKAEARRGIAIATSMRDEVFAAKIHSLSGRKDTFR